MEIQLLLELWIALPEWRTTIVAAWLVVFIQIPQQKPRRLNLPLRLKVWSLFRFMTSPAKQFIKPILKNILPDLTSSTSTFPDWKMVFMWSRLTQKMTQNQQEYQLSDSFPFC